MTEASTELPSELVAEAMTVMGRAFTAIRSATSQNYAMGARLSPERIAAVGMLSDALHNMPDWLRSDLPVRYRGDEDNVRDELAVAVGAIEFLHGRGSFVPRGPFRADFVQRLMPAMSEPSDAHGATPTGSTLGEGIAKRRVSRMGRLVVVCGVGMVLARGLGRRSNT